MDNILNIIPGSSMPIAEEISYNNKTSGISSTNVQNALDEMSNSISLVSNVANNATNVARNASLTAINANNNASMALQKANSAMTNATGAYSNAISAQSIANNAYKKANTASNTASNAYTQANTAYSRANSAYTQANNAYNRANTAYNSATNGQIVYSSFYNASAPNAGMNSASSTYAIAIGYNAKSYNNSASLGASSNSNTTSIAIGKQANAQYSSISIGLNSNCAGTPVVDSIAIGHNSDCWDANGIAIGYNARANSDTFLSTASCYGTIAIGTKANAQNQCGLAIGYMSNVEARNSTALGFQAYVSSTNTVQLGNASTLSKLSCRVNVTVTSDERDKTDIIDVTGSATDFLKKVRAVQYVYNHRELYIDDENLSDEERTKKAKYGLCNYNTISHKKGTKKGTRKRVGVLAQNVQAAMKEVYGSTSYANIVDDNFFDLDDIPDDVENQLSVNYSGFIPFLIKAIQELSERIDALEDKHKTTTGGSITI